MSNPDQSHCESVTEAKSQSINHHFKREGRLMIWIVVGVPVVLVLGALLIGPVLLNIVGK